MWEMVAVECREGKSVYAVARIKSAVLRFAMMCEMYWASSWLVVACVAKIVCLRTSSGSALLLLIVEEAASPAGRSFGCSTVQHEGTTSP
jgi:hypothetical protein